jgi:transcriptional regulator with XRE-family HTH domain
MAARARSVSSFGENVRRIRSALGMTQQRVAKEADLDPSYISGIERGMRNPRRSQCALRGFSDKAYLPEF